MRLKSHFGVLACVVIATWMIGGCAADDSNVNDAADWETAREQGRLAISEARFDDAAAAYRRAIELADTTEDPDHFRIISDAFFFEQRKQTTSSQWNGNIFGTVDVATLVFPLAVIDHGEVSLDRPAMRILTHLDTFVLVPVFHFSIF